MVKHHTMNKLHSQKPLAFVLGGGGSRGALQVGALRALFEADLAPDILVGTSIGAVNAVAIALWGYNAAGLDKMEQAWAQVADAQILDPRVSGLILKSLVGHPSQRARQKAEALFISLGITPDLNFGDIQGIQLGLVSADIQTGQPVIYGNNPQDSVLEGMMASITLPPWFTPSQKDGQLIVDGGAVSNLPIEPALNLGAQDIVALDLDLEVKVEEQDVSLQKYVEKLTAAVSRRYIQLETALADQQGVPVQRIDFREIETSPTWDFSQSTTLIQKGYEKTQQVLAGIAHGPAPQAS